MIATRLSRTGASVPVIAAVLAVSGFVQISAQTRDSAKEARVRALSGVAAHRTASTASEEATAIREALDDPDPDLRVAAANAVAGRAGAVRFKRTAQMENEWRQDVETLRAFRPRLWRALDDPNEQVRLAAILALGNLEYQGQERDGNIALGLELLTRLAALYEGEPTLLVRVEIAKTFALTSTDAPVRWNTLEVMLRDPAADVQQYAVVGVARSRSPETGARLLPLLASESRAVRMNAVQAIAMRGEESRAYVDDLRRMLSVETDLAVAKTIKGAITSLERER